MKVSHVVTFQDGDPYDKGLWSAGLLPALPLIDSGIKNAQHSGYSEYLATWPEKAWLFW